MLNIESVGPARRGLLDVAMALEAAQRAVNRALDVARARARSCNGSPVGASRNVSRIRTSLSTKRDLVVAPDVLVNGAHLTRVDSYRESYVSTSQ